MKTKTKSLLLAFVAVFVFLNSALAAPSSTASSSPAGESTLVTSRAALSADELASYATLDTQFRPVAEKKTAGAKFDTTTVVVVVIVAAAVVAIAAVSSSNSISVRP